MCLEIWLSFHSFSTLYDASQRAIVAPLTRHKPRFWELADGYSRFILHTPLLVQVAFAVLMVHESPRSFHFLLHYLVGKILYGQHPRSCSIKGTKFSLQMVPVVAIFLASALTIFCRYCSQASHSNNVYLVSSTTPPSQ